MTQTLELDGIHQEMRALCSECEEYLDPDELSPLYECDSCGEQFTRNTSWYDSHRCSCNRFAAKVAEVGCDSCLSECELVEAWICADGAAFAEQAEALAHQAGLVPMAQAIVVPAVIPARAVQRILQARHLLRDAVQAMHE